MQHQSRAMALSHRVDLRGLVAAEPLAGLSPPRVPRTGRALSGRPTCRIYAHGDGWVLEFDLPTGGWLDNGEIHSRRLTFPSLAAAIDYAERHGLDYRIEPPRHHRPTNRNRRVSGRLPRSWLARLARNGRKGHIYHG